MSRNYNKFVFLRRVGFCLAAGFLGGVMITAAAGLPSEAALVFFGIAAALTLTFLLRRRNFITYIFLAALFTGLGLGVIRLHSYGNLRSNLEEKVGSSVVLEGIITENPDERDTTTRLIVRLMETEEKVLVSTSPYQEFYYGDLVQVKGKLARPENFLTDSGREFDYASYLKVRGISHELSFAQVKVLKQGQGNILLATLYTVRRAFIGRLNLVLPEPHSSLMAGLLVGERRGLGEDLTAAFRKVGLVHVVVLSGYNMTIIAEAIIIVLSALLPFGLSLIFGALGILGFAFLVGGGATVVRASIMAVLALFARFTGKVYQASAALFIAGAAMVVLNPLVLLYDIGFQLSFIATLGLIYLAPLVERRLAFVPERAGLRGILSTTVAAQIAVLPWLFYTIGEVSLVSLPANILVTPLIPLTMLFGFVAGISGFISYLFSRFIAVFAYLFLALELLIVKLLSMIPLASVHVPEVSVGVVFVAYLGIIFWAYREYKKRYQHLEVKKD